MDAMSKHRWWVPTVVAAVMIGGAASGCSAARDASTTNRAAAPTEAPAAGAAAPSSPPGEADPAAVPDAVGRSDATQGRSFVSTATVTVKATDVGAAKQRAVEAAERNGGGLFADQTTFGTEARAVLTLKVVPEHFRNLLDEIAGLGRLADQRVTTDEVTGQVIDLDARVAAATASLQRTRALFERAGSITEITTLDKEVARREADLENLQGQRRALGDRVALATVTLTLENDREVTPAVADAQGTPLPGFTEGLAGGTHVASTAGTLALATIGALVPFIPVVVVLGLVLFALRRRRRDGRPTAAETTA